MSRGHWWGRVVVVALGALGPSSVAAAQDEVPRIPRIGERAPSFTAESTHGEIDFPQDYKGKWVVFFSHPSDFTPVCTTEFITFASMAPQFKALNTELLGLSIDSVYSHIAWVRTINQELSYRGMENVQVTFPIIADLSMDVAQTYGMIQPSASNTHAVRAVFIIDPQAIVRAIIYYPPSNGRNIDEIQRLLIALQTTDEHQVATPANWVPGEDVILPPPGTTQAARQRVEGAGRNYSCQAWFLCFRPLPKSKLSLPPPRQ